MNQIHRLLRTGALVGVSIVALSLCAATSWSSTTATTSTYLSDLAWTSATSGWGPVEKNKSNADLVAGDGRTITLNGTTYTKGLGTHAASDVRYALGGTCSSFDASVGIDDEVGNLGTVVFQVWTDGTKVYDSGVMTGATATKTVSVNVTGKSVLQLVVTNAGDNINYDHADWANARVTCGSNTGGGGSSSAPFVVDPPQPPSAYTVPSQAVVVRTSAELRSALSRTSPTTIVLENGTYDGTSSFENRYGHRIYARNLGGAILKAGLSVGSNWGSGAGVVRGITFDVSSQAKVISGGIVTTWGVGGKNAQILDCVIRGNAVIPYGVHATNPTGLVAQRLQLFNFTDGGLRLSNNQTVAYGSVTPIAQVISDISVDGVSRPDPGSSHGTAEAGLWIGHPVSQGVHRIRVRNVSLHGIETVNNAWNTAFSDLDLDLSKPTGPNTVGVYLEHFNYNNTFEEFRVVGAVLGFAAEWADPAWGSVAASHSTIIRNGVIDATGAVTSKTVGIFLDVGTASTTVTGVVFRNQSWAAIAAHQTVGQDRFENNDTSAIGPAAKAFSTQHWNSAIP